MLVIGARLYSIFEALNQLVYLESDDSIIFKQKMPSSVLIN